MNSQSFPLMFASLMLSFVIHLLPSDDLAGQEIGPSQILEIQDSEAQFNQMVRQISESFSQVGQKTPDWDQAEAAAQQAAANPNNPEAKRRQIEARATVLRGLLNNLRQACDDAEGFETVYKNHLTKIEAKIADAQNSRNSSIQLENEEEDFLVDCLSQLKALGGNLPKIPDAKEHYTFSPGERAKLTQEEIEAIELFDALLAKAELSLQQARDSRRIDDEQLKVLAARQLDAMKKYSAVRKSIAIARQDQDTFISIARTDLKYLNLIRQQETLARERQQPVPDYQLRQLPSFFSGGYTFSQNDGEEAEGDSRIRNLANDQRINRIEALLQQQSAESNDGEQQDE